MQFTHAIIAAITVFGASAAPAPWATTSASAPSSTGSSGGSATCPETSTEYCCDTSALLGLTCVLSSVLGNTCTEQTICCVDNGGTQTCSQTDGTAITVPITIGISL